MEISVDGKRLSLKENTTVREALKACGLNPEIFLVRLGREIIHENELLHDGDNLKLIRVISGG